MNRYNPDFHHRRSIRLKGYDYSLEGLYFITICCQNRICRFGTIENGKMVLNEYGINAHNEWVNTPKIRPNVELGEFIIMPNHIHGIIAITDRPPIRRGELHSPLLNSPQRSFLMGECNSPLRSPSQTVGAIVRGYKSSVTKQLGLLGFNEKLWQRNYYEHIIRNDQSFQNITEYIITNPLKWDNDTFNPLN